MQYFIFIIFLTFLRLFDFLTTIFVCPATYIKLECTDIFDGFFFMSTDKSDIGDLPEYSFLLYEQETSGDLMIIQLQNTGSNVLG